MKRCATGQQGPPSSWDGPRGRAGVPTRGVVARLGTRPDPALVRSLSSGNCDRLRHPERRHSVDHTRRDLRLPTLRLERPGSETIPDDPACRRDRCDRTGTSRSRHELADERPPPFAIDDGPPRRFSLSQHLAAARRPPPASTALPSAPTVASSAELPVSSEATTKPSASTPRCSVRQARRWFDVLCLWACHSPSPMIFSPVESMARWIGPSCGRTNSGTSTVVLRRESVVWSGVSRSRPIRRINAPTKPSVWRSGR
jgi:hypothetical protein